MSYFAELDKNNFVLRVIVADQDFISSRKVGDPSNWVETFIDNNYAGVGYTYDSQLKYFISPSPYPSWSFNRSTLVWEAPISRPIPADGYINYWDESSLSWKNLDSSLK